MSRANPSGGFWLAGPTTFWLWMVERQGFDAAREGVARTACPHSNAVERDYWEAGHRRGRCAQ